MSIHRSHRSQVATKLRVCLDDRGVVESVLPVQSSGFTNYDRTVLGRVREWAYQPLVVDGAPVAFCTYVTFIYISGSGVILNNPQNSVRAAPVQVPTRCTGRRCS